MTIYRRRIGSDTFHWMPTCSNWIGNKYIEVRAKKGSRPTTGELCQQCISKESAAKLKRSKS